jgi:phosphatidylglycerophosphate synthase
MITKLPKELENPIDILLNNLSIKLNPLFKKMNFTPNMITTLSLIFGFTGLKFYNQKKIILSIIFLWIAYLFDCMDGIYARKYKMVSKFGSYYDHIKDITLFFTFIYILVNKNINLNKKINSALVLLLFGFFEAVHIGCQEKYYSKNSTDKFLKFSKKLCKIKKNIKNELKITKYLGGATIWIVISLLIIYTI